MIGQAVGGTEKVRSAVLRELRRDSFGKFGDGQDTPLKSHKVWVKKNLISAWFKFFLCWLGLYCCFHIFVTDIGYYCNCYYCSFKFAALFLLSKLFGYLSIKSFFITFRSSKNLYLSTWNNSCQNRDYFDNGHTSFSHFVTKKTFKEVYSFCSIPTFISWWGTKQIKENIFQNHCR